MTKKPTQLHLMLPLNGRIKESPPDGIEEKRPENLVNKGKYTYREVISKLSQRGLVRARADKEK